jgi:glutamate-1-semialdehyde-2,1-aminomutase
MDIKLTESERLFNEASKVVPGGVNDARRPNKFYAGYYPIFMVKGKGSHCWDVDGNEYIDWACSFGPVVLGHCNPVVDEAVKKSLDEGFCFIMTHPVQIELAKKLIEIIPCAEMAKFMNGGSDGTSAAIRIARVYTGKDKVIRWGYHGWHDWCYGGAGTDREAFGVPANLKKDILSFTYNDLDSLEKVFNENKGEVACVIMQAFDSSIELPKKGFLEGVREITHRNEAVLIYDEVRTGFRAALGGAQQYTNVIPDMAVFSKAMANGYPIATVVGSKEVMQAAEKTRLSATFFPNSYQFYASLATIGEIQRRNGVEYMWKMGTKLVNGFKEIINEFGVDAIVDGIAPLPIIKFTDKNEERREEVKKKFFTEAVKRGVLFHPKMHYFLSLAITEEDLDKTLEVSREAMKIAKS